MSLRQARPQPSFSLTTTPSTVQDDPSDPGLLLSTPKPKLGFGKDMAVLIWGQAWLEGGAMAHQAQLTVGLELLEAQPSISMA